MKRAIEHENDVKTNNVKTKRSKLPSQNMVLIYKFEVRNYETNLCVGIGQQSVFS